MLSKMPANSGIGADPATAVESHRIQTLRRIAPALVGLEAFCRQKGLDDVAGRLEEAIIIIEIELTS